MKSLLSLAFIIILHLNASSQILEPVKWKFSKTKIDNNTFKVHLIATIQPKWHIYSQAQPKNSIAEPLRVTFNSNNSILFQGKPTEVGKLSKV